MDVNNIFIVAEHHPMKIDCNIFYHIPWIMDVNNIFIVIERHPIKIDVTLAAEPVWITLLSEVSFILYVMIFIFRNDLQFCFFLKLFKISYLVINYVLTILLSKNCRLHHCIFFCIFCLISTSQSDITNSSLASFSFRNTWCWIKLNLHLIIAINIQFQS